MIWNTNERRRFVRANTPCKTIIRNSQDQAFEGKTENVSLSGIRFTINQRLSLDSILDIEIFDIEDTPIKCKIQIKWIFIRTTSRSV